MAARKNYDEMSKDEKIISQIKTLSRQLIGVDAKKKKLVVSLVERAAYLTVSLEELEALIDEEGYKTKTVITYKNGMEDEVWRVNENVRTHTAMTKNLTSITKQLTDLCPEVVVKQRQSKLQKFRDGKLKA